VALASGLLTGAVALELRRDPEPAPEVPSPSAKGPSAAATLARLQRRFRVFRIPARPSDRVRVARAEAGPGAVGDVDAGYARENGLNVSLGRRLRKSPRVFAIPGRGSVCVVYERGGGGCTPEAVVDRSFQVHTCGHMARGRFEVSGLVADSAEAAFLRLADGRRFRLSISRNFADVTRRARSSGQLPTGVELQGSRGTQRVRVPRLTLQSLACEAPG
jgi:hypothetical protein